MRRVRGDARHKNTHVVRETDLRFWLQPVDQHVGAAVSLSEVAQAGAHAAPRYICRGTFLEQVRLRDIDIGFVDRHPVGDEVAKFAYYPVDETHEAGDVLVAGEFTSLGKPARIREVVQRHEGSDPCFDECFELVSVMGNGVSVENTFFGFDARPLQGHSVVANAKVAHQFDVLAPMLPVVDRSSGVGVVADSAGLLSPVMPVVVGVAALDLKGGRGDAQMQAGR